ncbi:MAG TPA: ABC transporter substrate-binding protein [Aliiroseovarius sp.]|nr:ABC transporter substrate-binding protein [Aliiroseovarius sp.]
MTNPLSRRFVLIGLSSLALIPNMALAFSVDKARALIDDVINEIQKIINSGKSESALLRDFEKIFSKYGDRDVIGQLVLGADGRSASSSQKRAFAKAFQGYISRKYGRRFREFAGATVEVKSAKAVKSFYEVTTTTTMQGQAPFEVIYVVSDKSGRFIDIKIEGISLIKSERSEIGAMLDRRGGDLNRLIAELKTI